MKKIGTKIKLIYNINLWYNENPIVYAADNSVVWSMQKCLKIYKYKNGIPGSLF